MPSLQQKIFFLSGLLSHCILLSGFFAFIACGTQQSKQIKNEFAKKNEPINDIEKDSFAAPMVIPIKSSNQPKIIKAGKPAIVIDTAGMGAPFFTNYAIEDGLPINFITYCIQDKEGNIWIGTGGGGLVKYNGKNFITYTTAHGLSDNFIENILQDKAGNIWVSTISNGVSKYDGKTFTNYSVAQGLASNLVLSIAQDDDGNMWFATRTGASMFNGKTFTTYDTTQGLPGNKVQCILKDKNGTMWFGCPGAGISRYDGKRFINYTVADGLCGNTIADMFQDRSDNIWISTYGEGISKYDGKAFTNYSTKQGLASDTLLRSMQDKDGNIWIGAAGGGVSIFNGKNFINYTTAQGLANNIVIKIMQDKGGRIWLCTLKGLSAFDGKSVTSYNKFGGCEHIMKDKDGKLWFSTFGRGVRCYDGKTFADYNIPQGLPSDIVFFSLQDKNGNIWLGNPKGATKFDGKNFTNYSAAQGLNTSVNCMLEDKDGNLWFGSNSAKGVFKFDGKSFTNFGKQQGLQGTEIRTIIEDKNGDIWFGSNSGISRLTGKKFINYTTADGLATNSAYCAAEDKEGNIWFGSGADGVSIYNGNHFIKYTTAEGLADNAVNAITTDTKRNMIWFGTNQGICGLKQSPLTKGFSPAEIFNASTGYPIKNFNNNGLIVDNNGIIWAGCESSVYIRFDYDAINKNLRPLSLQIENIKLNGEKICWNNLAQNTNKKSITDSLALINEMATAFGKILPPQWLDSMKKKFSDVHFDSIKPYYFIPVNLVVPYEDRNITIDFAAIEPDKPKQVKYQYMLEGYNNDWTPLENNTTAVFGNIPGGSYTFKLKALSPYGIWSQTSYSFTVLPPWWKTWWAYTIYAIFFIAFFVLIGWSIQRRLLKKERERNQLRELEMQALRAQMNPHFIFNCLSSINRFVLMNETEAASDYLTKFSRLIRTVLNNSKKSFISLEEELEMLGLYLDMEKLRFKNGFDYHISIHEDTEPQNIYIPPLLFQPFAENAVWHGLMHKKENGHLKINLNVENSILNFMIEDNGIGRDAASQSGSKSAEKNKSLGLQITKDRLSLINGYSSEETFFEIQDLYDEAGIALGTRVLLKIKFSETPDGYSN